MFNFLKGNKASVKVILDRTRCQPGETIHAQVAVECEKDLAIREGRIALVYREEHEYRYEEKRRDSDGHWHTSTNNQWQKADVEVARIAFLPETTITQNTLKSYTCDLTIPADGLPTCANGKIIRVHWFVKATLDRKMAGDVEDQAEVLVFTPPTGMGVAGQYGTSNEPNEATLALQLPGHELVLGETLEGQLLIHPVKSFGVSEVRVELVCIERVPTDLNGMPGQGVLGSAIWSVNLPGKRLLQNEAQTVEKVQVAGKARLEAGQDVAFPFRLAIPQERPVTGRYRDSSVIWVLKGILARSLRSDTQVEIAVIVFGARS